MTSRGVGGAGSRESDESARRGGEESRRGGSIRALRHAEPRRSISFSVAETDEILRFDRGDESGRVVSIDVARRGGESARIAPAPTDEEAAAIVAALALLEPDGDQPPSPPPLSAWGQAGRRAATRGIEGGAPIGWGRRERRR